MTTHLPAELELTFQYRSLQEELGAAITAAVFQRLWIDLALQTRVHGDAGYYKAFYIPGFVDRLDKLFPKLQGIGAKIAQSLVRSKLIEVKANGDWYCPMFFEFNGHLDKQHVPPSLMWAKDWEKFWEKLKAVAPTLNKTVDRTAWYRQDGSTVTESTMNRALVLICNLDTIIRRHAREPQELPVPLIHAACDVVTKHGELKLAAVLKRFMAMSRPRNNALAPSTTEEAIKVFDDLIVFVCPDEGFEKWVNHIEKNNEDTGKYEAESTAEDISQELAGELERLKAANG